MQDEKRAVSVRVKPEVWRRVKELAAANGESLERIVERALETVAPALRDMSHAPVGSWDERQVTGEGRVKRRPQAQGAAVSAVPPRSDGTCQRCGHLVRKHTPACDEVGCMCRRVEYREVEAPPG